MTDSAVITDRQASFSRSEEEDSDDSGVKDVSKKPDSNEDSRPRSNEKTEDNGNHEKSKGRDKSPTKKEREVNSEDNDIFNVGDLVWARSPNTTFYPCVVTQDSYFKFHTKIVKSDPGHHGNKSPGPGNSGDKGMRQYHVQYLGENKRTWLRDNLIIPYKGLAHYEKLAMEDLQNINKIYKPKSEASKTAWREAVIMAQQFEDLSNRERINKCELARAFERGGDKAIQKKLEIEKQRRNSESDRSPEKFKSPTSPKKNVDSEDKKKSMQYRRKDELQYKMSRSSEYDKRKRKSEDEKKVEEVKPIIPFNVFDASTTPTFNRSFKIKQIKPEPEEPITKSSPTLSETFSNESKAGNGICSDEQNNSTKQEIKEEEELESTPNHSSIDEEGNDKTFSSNSEDELTEGSLVWAKQRGYPYWPAVIARDPKDGEFVKLPQLSDSQNTNSQFKSQRKMHVLFLEYNNQRAWLSSGALQRYVGKRRFEEEAAKAGSNRKKDFVPGKRYQAQFDRAVEFSESLLKLPSEERLEAVFHKYGWVMVSEPGDGPDIGGTKSKKRKVVDCDLEANKSTDSEADSQPGSGPDSLAMHRRTSADRRSSAEAETRLDPGVDSLDGDIDTSTGPRIVSTPSGANKKKRESSLVAAIAMNGDSSSDENISDSDRSGSGSKKKRKHGSESVTPKLPKLKTENQSSPAAPPVIASETKSASRPAEDEFPRLGDLVWGRMSGFPFWPSFVTKSPAGQYKKVGSNGKANYHVQFFNWNDESGWVNAVLEFEGIDSFKKIAAKKKSDKSYNPAKGAMYNKWERAAKDAEETMDLTRSERLDCYLVTYGANQTKKIPAKSSPSVKNSKPSTPKPSTPKPKKPSTPGTPSGPSNQGRRMPGPASKTGLKASPTRATGGQLPAGWRIRNRDEGGQTFISPDGREFQDKSSALLYISTCVSQNSNVQYLSDPTLPSGWKCQKIQDSIYYFSPRGERFDTRDGVAVRLEEEGVSPDIIARIRRGGKKKRIGPKSVLRKIGYDVLSDESDRDSSTSEDEDPDHISRLPNGLKFRKGSRMDDYLDVDKLFDPSNGGMIEMVQLPDIFLGHPTVRVTESDNEMVISDVDTGEFIAKKIIYD